MMPTRTTNLFAAALVCALAAATAQAQTAPKPKKATEIPAGIAIPDKVETRLGTPLDVDPRLLPAGGR